MYALNNLAILALAGSAVAAPWRWGDWQNRPQGGSWQGNAPAAPAAPAGDSTSTSTVWDVQTATVTLYGDEPTPAAAPPADVPAPVAPEVTAAPSPSPAAFYSAPAAPAPEAPASSASSGWGSAPAPSTGGYMDVVSAARAAGGLPALAEDSTLAGNALKTAQDGNGQMKHELNPGTFGQVLAPGDMSDFKSIYIGGWLCEKPSLPGLDGICSSMAQGWDHSDGETGHADILSSTGYTKIGCAAAGGIVACDVA